MLFLVILVNLSFLVMNSHSNEISNHDREQNIHGNRTELNLNTNQVCLETLESYSKLINLIVIRLPRNPIKILIN